MKKRVKERKKKIAKDSGKRRWSSLRFYDITLELVVLFFLASLAAVAYMGGISNPVSIFFLTAYFIALLVFTLGILHHAIKRRFWFVALMITLFVVTGIWMTFDFLLYLGLYTAVLFYFITLRREFKGTTN